MKKQLKYLSFIWFILEPAYFQNTLLDKNPKHLSNPFHKNDIEVEAI